MQGTASAVEDQGCISAVLEKDSGAAWLRAAAKQKCSSSEQFGCLFQGTARVAVSAASPLARQSGALQQEVSDTGSKTAPAKPGFFCCCCSDIFEALWYHMGGGYY